KATCAITKPPPRVNHRPWDPPLASAVRLSFSAGVKSKRIPQGVKKNPGNHFALHKSGWAVASQIESNVPAQRRNAEKGVLERLEQCVEEGQGAGFAVFFSGLLCSAEAEQGLAAGLGGSEAALEIFFDGEFEVGGHFGVEFAVELCAAEKEWRRWEVCRSQVI